MRKIFYALLASLSLNAHAMTTPEPFITIDYGKAVVHHHPGLEACEWAYDGEQFTVFYDDKEFNVQPAFIDDVLRGISKEQLIAMLQFGYLYINRLDGGEFTIKAKMRLEGGMRKKKGEPLIVMLIGGAIIGTFCALRYLSGESEPANLHSEPANVHAEIVQEAAKAAPGIKSNGNKVDIAKPTCIVGGGLPRAILGGGAQKGPWMRVAPMDKIPTPTAPAPRGPRPAPRPSPKPTIPFPVPQQV